MNEISNVPGAYMVHSTGGGIDGGDAVYLWASMGVRLQL
jgi:hypothetical protein